MEETDFLFDRVLTSAGDNGKYQKRFNFIFNFLLVICCSMAYNNLTIIMAVPNHWCHIPGRENTSYSLTEWRNMHIPQVVDSMGKISLSSCEMYNPLKNYNGMQPDDSDITSCQYGYDYDQTWYRSTVGTANDWVCEKYLYNSNILAASRLGVVFGTFILGQLGDYIGRRPTFLISVILCLLAKTVSLLTSNFYYLFLVANSLALFPALSAIQCTLLIGTEMSNTKQRASMVQVQNLSYCLGMMIMPLVFWFIPNWTLAYITTTAPLLVFVLLYGLTIESPKWLVSRGNIKAALEGLNKISEVNSTKMEPEFVRQLKNHTVIREKMFGVMSTLSSWRLAKNTVILNTATTIPQLCMFIIALNSTNLKGNPYLNFAWQAAAEAPAYIFGKILCDKIGRRYAGSVTFLFSAGIFLSVTFIAKYENLVAITNALVVVGKFFLSISFYTVFLQTMEIYPTCIRQSGMSLGVAISGGFSILCPYIVFLGTTVDARYPYAIMSAMAIFSAVLELFLPETLHVKLPESLREAKEFGKNQAFFNFPVKPKDIISPEELRFIDEKTVFEKMNKFNTNV